MSVSKTIVISCAGVGSRLGFGHTKALLKIAGKPLIIHHLERLQRFDDVRIVVGFNAEDLINTVLSYRKDVIFVFNHNYLITSTLQSLKLGVAFAREYIVSLDGDLLVAPADLDAFLKEDEEIMGYISAYSDEPVYTTIEKRAGGQDYVTSFNRKSGRWEWTGLIQIKKTKIADQGKYVYNAIKNHLPFRAKYVNCREIDTPNDYKKALAWAENIFKR